MLSWSLKVFSQLGAFLTSVIPLATEITEKKTKPKVCKITVFQVGLSYLELKFLKSILKSYLECLGPLIQRVDRTVVPVHGIACHNSYRAHQ